MSDLSDTLKKFDITKGAKAVTDAASAVASPILKAVGLESKGPGLPSQGYNRDGSPPAYPPPSPVQKVNDRIKKIP
jgi:hypothetical protein